MTEGWDISVRGGFRSMLGCENRYPLLITQRKPLDLLHPDDQLLNIGSRCELPSPKQAKNSREVNDINTVGLTVSHCTSIVAQQGNVALLADRDGFTFACVE